ncbi:hypothetical protein KA977_01950 [Candidatus Dependentiae bacterium]|nr:hypothetical protein [Candidatus Dependentiae bacterium]
MNFSFLDKNHKLFEKLAKNPPIWWDVLKNDKEIIIEIRKDNSIDVYYKGGAIITSLKFSKNLFHGKIHYEYIPLKCELKNPYILYKITDDKISFDQKNCKILELNNFSREDLKFLKKRIALFNTPDSEKSIQYSFVENDPYFIDSEFEYPFENSTIRIDLIRIDTQSKKIVFVEVKRIGDARLFNAEISIQLKQYSNFIKKYSEELLGYYKELFEIKKKLNLLSDELKKISNLDNYEILSKPLLLLGDCQQSWIDNNSKNIDNKISETAIGAYYLGGTSYKSNLISKTFKNKHIF